MSVVDKLFQTKYNLLVIYSVVPLSINHPYAFFKGVNNLKALILLLFCNLWSALGLPESEQEQ